MLGVAGEQSEPLQQRFGFGAVCGVHVSPEAHALVESQRHPRWPATHVDVTLGGGALGGIAQSVPLQQRSEFGACCGVHVKPGLQMWLLPAHGQPCQPRMQPGGTMMPPVPLSPPAPGEPPLPIAPAAPLAPDVPETPPAPSAPETPLAPDAPDAPLTPEAPPDVDPEAPASPPDPAGFAPPPLTPDAPLRSEEHTSELQSH